MANNRLYLYSSADKSYIFLDKHFGLDGEFSVNDILRSLERPKAREWIEEHLSPMAGFGSGVFQLKYECSVYGNELPDDAVWVDTHDSSEER